MGTKIIETGSTAGGIAKVEYKDEAGNVLWYYDDAGNFVRSGNIKIDGNLSGTNNIAITDANGAITSSQYKLSALNTAPASPTATGTTGEVRVTGNGIYYCTATNTWIKALPVVVASETLSELTTTFTASTLSAIYASNKYLWRIRSGAHSATIESTHNLYSGVNVWSLVTGPSVAQVTANSVYSFRLGDSVIEIKFDVNSGNVSYRVASGTITSITVNRMTIPIGWQEDKKWDIKST